MYRKERKKTRKLSERVSVSEDGSSGSPARMDTDDGQGVTSSSGEDSSMEDDSIHIELTPELREILETDFYFIKEKNKVSSIVSLLCIFLFLFYLSYNYVELALFN